MTKRKMGMTKREMQARIDWLEREVANLRLLLFPPRYVQPCDPVIQIQRPQEYERPSVTCFQAVP